MKCISVCQPFATLLVLGAKRYETRCWKTAHRGRLGIHASGHWPPEARALCQQEPFQALLRAAGYTAWDVLPTGVLLGTVALVRCLNVGELPQLSATERALGDFQEGRWAWEVTDARCLPTPVPCRGRLGLFDCPCPEG